MDSLDRLPVLLCWLLSLFGAAISAGAGWVDWLGTRTPSEQNLPLAEALGLPTARYWVALADLRSKREEECLRRAVQADDRYLPALLRLALIEEFRGDRHLARAWVDRAVGTHRSYQAYMAALTQAARWKDEARIVSLARQALAYCPRDADGIYSQLGALPLANKALAGADPGRRGDYLRYLLGQDRTLEALQYQSGLPPSQLVNRYRLELCERLFWKGRQTEASDLFGTLHPEFKSEGRYNLRLLTEPSSLGFDWRLRTDGKIQSTWRPGELELNLRSQGAPVEILSILVEDRGHSVSKVMALWSGQTEDLNWRVEEISPRWKRVALVASPGKDRRFQLKEVRFE